MPIRDVFERTILNKRSEKDIRRVDLGTFGTEAAASSTPLHRLLYERLKREIVSGRLETGRKLPSTRSLAAELNLSRNTVVSAYELLSADDLVVARVGGGTIVRGTPSLNAAKFPRASERDAVTGTQETAAGPFSVGVPAVDQFPFKAWNRTLTRCARAQTGSDIGYRHAAGHEGLRRFLATYLLTRRGLHCEPDQIVVVPGYQAGLHLVTLALLKTEDEVWVEDPGHGPTRRALARQGMRLRSVPVDAGGPDVDFAIARWPQGRMVVLTPAHQFPFGMTLDARRRNSILNWARDSETWIVEDDYNTEFHFVGKAPDALAAGDRNGRVIYIGTFSKVMFPSLRIAYVVVPPSLVDLFVSLRTTIDGHQSHFMQEVLHEFIAAGSFERHLGRMRSLYRKRQQAVLSAVLDASRGQVRPFEAPGGTHFVAMFDDPEIDDVAFAERARRAGVALAPLRAFRLDPGPPGLVIGFSNCSPDALASARSTLEAIFAAPSSIELAEI